MSSVLVRQVDSLESPESPPTRFTGLLADSDRPMLVEWKACYKVRWAVCHNLRSSGIAGHYEAHEFTLPDRDGPAFATTRLPSFGTGILCGLVLAGTRSTVDARGSDMSTKFCQESEKSSFDMYL